ncbi:endonuclease [Burkholderia cepacia]|uniref:YqaJ viral recombinase family nuclease n=1 Tax=Burkholderia cepacia complex TaxID=87882 RepID=UPI0007554D6D|nr:MULTISPECIES: YqaJ viral recombinase family protein [Burkholderia cepacia complex]KVS50668.1 endonuclease [Burkholderia cepacia]KVS65694.1 endonuclease [Burkholderia cepacia]KWO46374.1 endonuclease [Burkholderia territorii]
MDRESWLALRRTGIGGSDAAAALGESPYQTPYELYLDKLGLAPPREETERMRMGRRLEAVIADEYALTRVVKLRRRNQPVRHPKYPWMLASPDRLVEGQRLGLEAKSVDPAAFRFGEWGDEGSDQVPTHYLLQVCHYMCVLDYARWDLAALVGGNHLRVYTIHRDVELEEMLIEREHAFWQHVERREPPEPGFEHPSTLPLLRRLHPGTDGSVIELPPLADAVHAVRVDFDEQVKTYQAGVDAARARLLHMMGDAAVGRLPSGGEYRRKVVERSRYEVAASSYVDFRFSKGKEAL